MSNLNYLFKNYMYLISNTMLSFFNAFFLIYIMTPSDYGEYIYILYLLNSLTILTLGIQDYYKVTYRFNNSFFVIKKLYLFLFIIQLFFNIFIIIFGFMTGIELILLVGLFALLPNNMTISFRYIFLLNDNIFLFNSIDLFNKIILLICGLVYYFNTSILIFIILFAILKYLLLFIYIIIIIIYVRPSVEYNYIKISYLKVLYQGFFILLGFWLIFNSFNLDILLFDKNNPTMLGQFGKIKAISGLLLSLLMPMRNIVLMRLNPNNKNGLLKLMNYYSIVLLLILTVVGLINFVIRIPVLNYLLFYGLIVIIFAPITIIYSNLFLDKKKKFIIYSSAIFIIFLIPQLLLLLSSNQYIYTVIIAQFISVSFAYVISDFIFFGFSRSKQLFFTVSLIFLNAYIFVGVL